MKCPEDAVQPFNGCSSVKTLIPIHVPQANGTIKIISVEVCGWECDGEIYLSGDTIDYLDRYKLNEMGMGNAVLAKVPCGLKYVLFDGVPEYEKEVKFRLAEYGSAWQTGKVIAGTPIEIIRDY